MQINFKLFVIFVGAVVALGFLLFNFVPTRSRGSSPAGGTTRQTSQVCLEEICFDVEIANTNAKREQGLMNRENLGENKGMLFVFDKEDIYSFWMKNTLISLDMIWMDEAGKIVFIKENSEPCKDGEACPFITPKAKAKYVLEINTGLVKEMGLKTGDNLDINW